MSAAALHAILQRFDDATSDDERRSCMAEFVEALYDTSALCPRCKCPMPSIGKACAACALRTACTAPEEMLP